MSCDITDFDLVMRADELAQKAGGLKDDIGAEICRQQGAAWISAPTSVYPTDNDAKVNASYAKFNRM